MADFITIDFETAAYASESACSIGLVKYCNYKPVSSYYSLICPPNLYVRPDFTAIHGLTTEDIKDAPDFNYLWKHEIRSFIGSTLLAAHNAQFDMRVLRYTLAYYDIPVPKIKYFCSLKLARRVWQLQSYSLSALAKHFEINYNAHNALADAETCGRIITLCAMELTDGKPSDDLPHIRDILAKTDIAVQKLSN